MICKIQGFDWVPRSKLDKNSNAPFYDLKLATELWFHHFISTALRLSLDLTQWFQKMFFTSDFPNELLVCSESFSLNQSFLLYFNCQGQIHVPAPDFPELQPVGDAARGGGVQFPLDWARLYKEDWGCTSKIGRSSFYLGEAAEEFYRVTQVPLVISFSIQNFPKSPNAKQPLVFSSHWSGGKF